VSILSGDFETRSTVELKSAGVYRYAEDPTTDIWCLAYAFDDEEPEIWTPPTCDCRTLVPPAVCDECGIWNKGTPYVAAGLPERVVEHIQAGGEFRAWNCAFERIMWNSIMVKRYGAPPLALEQCYCTAAEAAAMALPRALGNAADVLGVEQQKDDAGYRLMLRMARPRRVMPDGTIIWWDVPDKKQKLFSYCKQDVRTERSIYKVTRRLVPGEREKYMLDQRMNDRGIVLDRALVEAAKDIVDVGVTRANARLHDITQGDVAGVTKRDDLVEWLNTQGLVTESISKPALAALLERDDIAANVREVLELRANAGRSSVAKLDSMLEVVQADGVLRGLLLYHAASTGREGGRLVQPHNFPRGEVKDVELFIPAVLEGDYDYLDLFAPPIVIVLSMLRSMLVARPGHDLIAADYSAIEARVLDWLADQQDAVEAWRQYDAADKADKPKFDPYRVMAVRMGLATAPELVTKEQRNAGKAAKLGLGFGMGEKKFVTASWDVYQVRVTEEQALAAKNIYRDACDKVKRFWYDTNQACIDAVSKPGTVQVFGGLKNLKATKRGGYLYIILPSGRPLCYPAPSIEEREMPWSTPEAPATKMSLHYWGVNQVTRQWCKIGAYGGLLVENIVQAVARDLMMDATGRAEERGYLPVLNVHDEVVTDVPRDFGSVKEFEQLMAETPAWATGCPVAAEGWRGPRYRK
jgi:DNA polymerase